MYSSSQKFRHVFPFMCMYVVQHVAAACFLQLHVSIRCKYSSCLLLQFTHISMKFSLRDLRSSETLRSSLEFKIVIQLETVGDVLRSIIIMKIHIMDIKRRPVFCSVKVWVVFFFFFMVGVNKLFYDSCCRSSQQQLLSI